MQDNVINQCIKTKVKPKIYLQSIFNYLQYQNEIIPETQDQEISGAIVRSQ